MPRTKVLVRKAVPSKAPLDDALILKLPDATRDTNLKIEQYTVTDIYEPGFYLLVGESARTFFLKAPLKLPDGTKKPVKRNLGRYGEVTVEEARKLAKELKAELIKGIDRNAMPKAEIPNTFGELIAWYIRDYASKEVAPGRPRKKTWAKDKQRLESHCKGWLTIPPERITKKMASDLHSDITGKGTPGAADRTLQAVRAVFNWAKSKDLVKGDNPVMGMRKEWNGDVSRDAWIQPQQLPLFWDALNKETNDYIRTAFIVTLFTAARPEEILTIRWEDIDLEYMIWDKPDVKNPRQNATKPLRQILPITQYVAETIERLHRVPGNPYVFAGEKEGQHLVYVRKAWNRIRDKAMLGDVVHRDLRRTFTSYAEGLGYDKDEILKGFLNHADMSVTARYIVQDNPARMERIRKSMTEVGIHILDFCEGRKKAEPLRRSKLA